MLKDNVSHDNFIVSSEWTDTLIISIMDRSCLFWFSILIEDKSRKKQKKIK
jgi:hypothetical protein